MTCRCAPNARCGRCEDVRSAHKPDIAITFDAPDVYAEIRRLLRADRCPRCTRRPSKSMGCPTKCKEVRR